MLTKKVRYFLEISAPSLFQKFNREKCLDGVVSDFNDLATAYFSSLDDSYPILTSNVPEDEILRWGVYWELIGPYLCADTNEFIVSIALRSNHEILLHASYIPRTNKFIFKTN